MAPKSPPTYPDSPVPDSFERGLEFQDFVVDVLREQLGMVITNYQSQRFQFGAGENKQGIEIKVVRPGMVERLRKARTPKRCSLCGLQIKPGDLYWSRKVSWRRCREPVCERCA